MSRKQSKNYKSCLAVLTAGFIFAGGALSSFAASGTVTSSNVKVRSEASTSATQVSSLDSGDKVDIIDETTDSQGYVWYRIYVNGTEYGYVRSDLVSKSGDTSSQTQTTEKPKEALPETQVTAVDAQPATVTVASANVRSGAGTGYDTVGTVPNGDTVTVTGEATGTDSKKWYQISFGSSGRTGFVRADLVQIGAPAEAPAENAEGGDDPEAPEAQEGAEVSDDPEAPENAEPVQDTEGAAEANPEVPVDTSVGNGEFSLAYKDDGTGTEVWYLYDNVEGTQVKLNDLLTYAAAGQQAEKLESQVGKLKAVLIVMAVIIALLVLAVLLLIYRLRDYSYYEEEEEPEEKPSRKKDSFDDILPQRGFRRGAAEPAASEQSGTRGRVVADSRRSEKPERTVTPTREKRNAPMGTAESLLRTDKSERSIQPEKRSQGRSASQAAPSRPSADESRSQAAPSPQPSGRKPRNFLLEDDDFEFEFLDLDDDEK